MACCTGAIPEAFRARADAVRGLHPTHSCAAVGPLAIDMLEDHELDVTPCGMRSPYQRLIRAGGLLVLLGVDLQVNTTYHALEEMAGCPYLLDGYAMYYTACADGSRLRVPSRRHRGGLDRAFEATAPLLRQAGALREARVGQAVVRVVDAALMERTIMPLLARDPLYLLTDEAADRWRKDDGH
jgi:aminoglycoside 3-N-acetyltransferase